MYKDTKTEIIEYIITCLLKEHELIAYAHRRRRLIDFVIERSVFGPFVYAGVGGS